MIYLFLATGFEECEALGIVDTCRRAGLEVNIVSITGELVVRSAHGVGICAATLFEENDYTNATMLALPGGIPGATNLYAYAPLRELLIEHAKAGKALAAICAAPLVLGLLGLLKGKKATCYPGFEDKLIGATPTGKMVEVDGNILTGKGPAAAYFLGYAIIEHFKGHEVAKQVADGMLVTGV